MVTPTDALANTPLPKRRAEVAFTAIQNVINGHLSIKEKDAYKQLAKSAPADIQSNGLGQTLAFWKSKGEPEKMALLEDIAGWLYTLNLSQQSDVVRWIVIEASPEEYRQATAETIAFLVWVKRFAEGYLP